MILAKSIAECRQARSRLGKLAFVPTMGALHAGHVSLMTLAHQHAPAVAVSIFVNPTQFAPTEDPVALSRPLEADLAKCEAAGVDLVFLPTSSEIYPPGVPAMEIRFPELFGVLEGASRPTHFAGVCQVVAKLFNIVQPELAVFGQKDFQQLRIIAAMVEALDFPIEIVPGPTLRDPDGLAMSSRNQYLSPDQRRRALSISRGLFSAQAQATRGERQAGVLVESIRQEIASQNLAIDYIAAVNPMTLREVQTIDEKTVIAVAARVGTTRLIDNVTVALL